MPVRSQPHFCTNITFIKISIHRIRHVHQLNLSLATLLAADSIRTTKSAIDNSKLFECSIVKRNPRKMPFEWCYSKTDWVPPKEAQKMASNLLSTHKKERREKKNKSTQLSIYARIKCRKNSKLNTILHMNSEYFMLCMVGLLSICPQRLQNQTSITR